MSQMKQLVVAAVAGAVTSFVGVALFSPKVPARAVDVSSSEDAKAVQLVPQAAGAAGKTEVALRNQLAKLEQRLDGIEDQSARATPEEAAPEATDDPGPTAEEFSDQHYETYASQNMDRVWAPSAEAKLNAELQMFGTKEGFDLAEVECRNDACIATVEFPTYANAKDKLGLLVNLPLSVNCEMGATVPEPSDPSASYSVQVFMTNCQKQPS